MGDEITFNDAVCLDVQRIILGVTFKIFDYRGHPTKVREKAWRVNRLVCKDWKYAVDSVFPFKESRAMFRSIERGCTESVKMLLANENVDPSEEGNEAIFYSVYRNRFDIFCLLHKDPRVDPSGDMNRTLRRAVRNVQLEIVKILLKDSRIDPTIGNIANEAHCSGSEDMCKLLLSEPRVSSDLHSIIIKKGMPWRRLCD